ncbi:hypothetical protein PGT21_029031 [Puccinia graminis f. sp. tritici]|uniref:Uncharacterized protein n=1 Tax=Puccinia graminis f. sp. tritici TaxID=56615 RepID=A0A5B0S083_PUCGR|nr:hypothetical protein PGT21_029031 [Puccinia graminis f. sp. tritici]KAA1131247.1 hypothetical protein PGTUg99_027096 [Puccinia graminis f. sp. tritici]
MRVEDMWDSWSLRDKKDGSPEPLLLLTREHGNSSEEKAAETLEGRMRWNDQRRAVRRGSSNKFGTALRFGMLDMYLQLEKLGLKLHSSDRGSPAARAWLEGPLRRTWLIGVGELKHARALFDTSQKSFLGLRRSRLNPSSFHLQLTHIVSYHKAARQLKNHFDATPQRQHMSEVSPAGEAPDGRFNDRRRWIMHLLLIYSTPTRPVTPASMKLSNTESEEEYWGSSIMRRVSGSSGSALTLSGFAPRKCIIAWAGNVRSGEIFSYEDNCCFFCRRQRTFVDEEANCLPLALGLTTESHQAGPRPRGACAKLESCNSGCPIVKLKENTSPLAECRRGHRREELIQPGKVLGCGEMSSKRLSRTLRQADPDILVKKKYQDIFSVLQ